MIFEARCPSNSCCYCIENSNGNWSYPWSVCQDCCGSSKSRSNKRRRSSPSCSRPVSFSILTKLRTLYWTDFYGWSSPSNLCCPSGALSSIRKWPRCNWLSSARTIELPCRSSRRFRFEIGLSQFFRLSSTVSRCFAGSYYVWRISLFGTSSSAFCESIPSKRFSPIFFCIVA